MGRINLDLTMSQKGFSNDRNGSVEDRYPDLDELLKTGPRKASIRTTGTVVMGRHAFEMGDPDKYAYHYEYHVPIFVLTTHIPQKPFKQPKLLTLPFVQEGIENPISLAKTAASGR
jgi:dihydrofolate reductase